MRLRVGVLLLAGAVLGAGLSVVAASATSVPAPPVRPVTAVVGAVRAPQALEAPPPTEAPAPDPTPSPSAAEPTPADSPRTAPVPGATTEVDPALTARLDALLADPELAPAGAVGVAVLDEDGAPVYSAGADLAVLPASTQKLVVAVGALATLGPDHRFTTTAAGTGPVGPDGTLAGDVVLIGGGDPVLESPVFATQIRPQRPHTPLAWVADQLVEAGVRRVTGRVLGDPGVYADQPFPSGWLPSYLTDLEGSPTAGLTIDAGLRMGIEDGRVLGYPSDDPAAEAAGQLVNLLGQRGVTVDGGWGATRTPPPTTTELARVDSPPLGDLLRYMVQRSDNQLADGIFRAVGAAAGDPTWTGAATATREALADLGLDAEGLVLADGSGLSRDNRLSAAFLARLDQVLSGSTASAEWADLMAVAGESGTLRRRLIGTLAEGRLRGKTGSLRDVRAIAGAVLGPDGTRYHVAVVGNDLVGGTDAAVRRLQDEVVLALTEDLYGCIRVEIPASPPEQPPTPDQPPPPPVLELRCAA